jgi:hypothetical protein
MSSVFLFLGNNDRALCISRCKRNRTMTNIYSRGASLTLDHLLCSRHLKYSLVKFSLDYKGIQPGMAAQPMRMR